MQSWVRKINGRLTELDLIVPTRPSSHQGTYRNSGLQLLVAPRIRIHSAFEVVSDQKSRL